MLHHCWFATFKFGFFWCFVLLLGFFFGFVSIAMIWACYCYNLHCCVAKKFKFSLFFAFVLGFITSTTLSFKLWRINSFKLQHICNLQFFSLCIFYCFMDDLDNMVLFLTRCMLLFQIMDYVFKFFFYIVSTSKLLQFQPNFWNEYNFFLIIIMFYYFQLYNCFLVLSQDLGH